jgi:predicted Zn-dependent protease
MRRVVLVALALLSTCCHPARIPARLSSSCFYPHLPLEIVLEAELSWQTSAYARAAQTWNTALGFEVFKVSDGLGGLDVVVVTGPPEEKPEVMATTQRDANERGECSSLIVIRHAMDSEEQAYVFAVHELGHALGVGHADLGRSFMSPSLDYTMGRRWYRLEEMDVARARGGLGL